MKDERTLSTSTVLVFDTETTGLETDEARIVQLGGVYLEQLKLKRPALSELVNPGVPIPPEVTEVHGIRDADVADAPRFVDVAPRFVRRLIGTEDTGAPILCGYNAPGYDVPLINAEFDRHGIEHRIDPTEVIDPLVFVRWHHRDWRVRNLETVATRYGYTFTRAHSAADDAAATGHLLARMVQDELIPDRVDEALAAQHKLADALEFEWIRFGYAVYPDRVSGRPCIGFGKHCGTLLSEMEPGYLDWCLKKFDDLTEEARELFQTTRTERGDDRTRP